MGGQPAASNAGSPTPNGCSRARSRHHPGTPTVAEPDLSSGPVTRRGRAHAHPMNGEGNGTGIRRGVSSLDESSATQIPHGNDDHASSLRNNPSSVELARTAARLTCRTATMSGQQAARVAFAEADCPPSSSGRSITMGVDRLPRWCEIWPWRNTQSRPFLREISNRNAQLRMCSRFGGGAS